MQTLKRIYISGALLILHTPSAVFAATASGGSGGGALDNPIQFNSFSEFIAAILNIVVTIGIPIAAVFIIYSGFLFVTAQGNTEQLTKARSALIWAVVGTAILLGASVIADVIENTVDSIR